MKRKSKKRGLFISFEGGEGSGKTSQIAATSAWLKRRGFTIVRTQEPGGQSKIGRAIRKILLDPRNGHMADRSELLLYAADRAQNMEEIIKPALAKGHIVLCDRHADSTTVYQGICRKLGLKTTDWLNGFATSNVKPDLTLLVDVPVSVGLSRISSRGALDRMENQKRAFHEKVRRGFLKLARDNPSRIKLIDGSKPRKEVSLEVQAFLQKILKRKGLWKN